MAETKRSLRRWTVILVYFLVVLVVLLLIVRVDVGSWLHLGDVHSDATTSVITLESPRREDATSRDESLQYVPQNVVRAWSERDYLIVFGIPSVDIDVRRRRRYLQRSTCWRFPGVATRANNFTGAMLVLYVFGRHPSHNFTYSASLQREAAEWHDVIALPMNEGRPFTNGAAGSSGYWNIEVGVGLSRKVFVWFELALRLFPYGMYIAKGDDDMILRVPQFLADLRTLPRRRVYWGTIYIPRVWRNNTSVRFPFAFGACYTLSRDVAHQFVSYGPLERLVRIPYAKELDTQYVNMEVHSEDAMVGLALKKSGYARRLVLVREPRCSFHDIHSGPAMGFVQSSSVMVHHLWESDYEELMRRFRNVSRTVPRHRKIMRRRIEFVC
ncbi:UDP-Gal or UDP-GlcNAc-dependent glycosyltransferase [Trypanosoma grayi]|uniref:UDP-Gal or UDP-GlcNAc-dependent glycosyltransferase n=1 Tax=Trypanosoma grayi TaxID=71804 RepID=UPI0004F48579|nr:UDP-Gal or UDP-GlcNAc-dependent glycosyltransferase [Trypanosoma grayi]KEG07024.1 UDP-Gal or UDP-GlcNAc-dependent glycosyltransferase [Trypanosoma grayi]